MNGVEAVKPSFIQLAGGPNAIFNGIIILVLLGLFFHHVKRLSSQVQVGLIGGNAILLLGLKLGLGLDMLMAFFALFLLNLVTFAAIGIGLRREDARVAELEEQLVNALLILSGSLKAGRSLEQGFDLVQRSLAPPISHEFMLVLQNQSLGIPFEKALRGMLDRIPSRDFRLFVTATLFQRETGGNIISLYDEIIGAIAERKKMRGKMDAMSVQGRYSGYIIAMLPVAMFGIMCLTNPEYVSVFWEVAWARTLFVLAIVLEVTGVVAIHGILNRKVA